MQWHGGARRELAQARFLRETSRYAARQYIVVDEAFDSRNRQYISEMARDERLRELSLQWLLRGYRHEYSYHFTWLGLPVIQYPQDVMALQEIIWRVKPDAIVETGIARGGSLIFSASILRILGGDRLVVGVDIDIRRHTKVAMEGHPLADSVVMIEGSSVDPLTFTAVQERVRGRKRILVILDSNHDHQHVLEELRLYSSLVTAGSYVIVFDTIVEHLPEDFCRNRPWGKGNNPMTAVHEFLKGSNRFVIDNEIESKLLITAAPDGYLRCVED